MMAKQKGDRPSNKCEIAKQSRLLSTARCIRTHKRIKAIFVLTIIELYILLLLLLYLQYTRDYIVYRTTRRSLLVFVYFFSLFIHSRHSCFMQTRFPPHYDINRSSRSIFGFIRAIPYITVIVTERQRVQKSRNKCGTGKKKTEKR